MCNHDKNKAQQRLTTLRTRTCTFKRTLSLSVSHTHARHVERGCFIQQCSITEGRPQSWKNSKLGHEGKTGELAYCCSTCGLVYFHTHILCYSAEQTANVKVDQPGQLWSFYQQNSNLIDYIPILVIS